MSIIKEWLSVWFDDPFEDGGSIEVDEAQLEDLQNMIDDQLAIDKLNEDWDDNEDFAGLGDE